MHSTKFVSFPERLQELARVMPERVALSADADLTYHALWQWIDNVTEALARGWNVQRGDRIAYLGLNHPAQIAILAALMRLGALFVPLNYRLAAAELRTTLADAGASLLIADSSFASIAADMGIRIADRDTLAWTTGGHSASDDDRNGSDDACGGSRPGAGAQFRQDENAGNDPDQPALLVYTSGTTGAPKGAVHTQRTMHANVVASQALHAFSANDVVLAVLPLFHIGGLCIQTIPALHAGARVILHSRFDAGAWLRSVEADHATVSLLVPATIRAVQEHPRWDATDVSSLRILAAGSSTIPRSLIERFHERHVPVCQVYGATETGPVSIVVDVADAFAHVGAAGKPALGTTIRLADEHGDAIEQTDTVGEIHVRGANVASGYWHTDGSRDPRAFAGGWFRTGDLGSRDRDGFYTIVGRAKDMIISGGENIYPAEIENVLAECDGVADVAVVGIADAQWGEVPVAVIVARDGIVIDESAIRTALDDRLARFKHPRRILFRATLPRNALGKVQKSALVDELG